MAVDFRGEVFSLSRWAGVKAKDLKARLGEPDTSPSIEEVKANISNRMTNTLQDYIHKTEIQTQAQLQPLLRRKNELKNTHREERRILHDFQEERWKRETIIRSERLPKGLRSIWYRVTGQYQKVRQQNEREADFCLIRDRDEKQAQTRMSTIYMGHCLYLILELMLLKRSTMQLDIYLSILKRGWNLANIQYL